MIGLDRLSTLILFTDFVLMFFTEFYESPQMRVRKLGTIFCNYLCSLWLVLDALAIFPFREFGYEAIDYWLRLSRLLKLKKVIDVVDVVGVKLTVKLMKQSRL
jgi:hypothetical protein